MNHAALCHYLHILDLAQTDSEYATLVSQYRQMNDSILDLFSRLPDADASLIMDYVGLIGAMGLRVLEIACSNTQNS